MVRIMNIATAPRRAMEGRGETVPLIGEEIGSARLDLHVNILKASGTPGTYHRHPDNDNVYVVLSGRGLFVAEGVPRTLAKDDVVFIPAGTPHSMSATGDSDLILLEIYAPARCEMVPAT